MLTSIPRLTTGLLLLSDKLLEEQVAMDEYSLEFVIRYIVFLRKIVYATTRYNPIAVRNVSMYEGTQT